MLLHEVRVVRCGMFQNRGQASGIVGILSTQAGSWPKKEGNAMSAARPAGPIQASQQTSSGELLC